MNSPSIVPVSGRPQDHRALRAILISQAYNVMEARNSELAPAKARLLFKKRAVARQQARVEMRPWPISRAFESVKWTDSLRRASQSARKLAGSSPRMNALMGARKNWDRNRSPDGARVQVALPSIFQAAKQEARNRFDVVREFLRSSRIWSPVKRRRSTLSFARTYPHAYTLT